MGMDVELPRVKIKFLERAVQAKYDMVAASLRSVHTSMECNDNVYPHIYFSKIVHEPADYLMPGANLVRRIDDFISHYQKVLTPDEAEKADIELSEIVAAVEKFITEGFSEEKMSFPFHDMKAEERVKIIADLPLVKLRSLLAEWDAASAKNMHIAHVTISSTPEPVARKIVSDAMLGRWDGQKAGGYAPALEQ